jgi:hypothetical protein
MSRRRQFDMAALRRREIERFARAIDVADTDDFRRFLIAWAWHNPTSKDPMGALTLAAKRMGRAISEAEADEALDEAAAVPKCRTADALGKYLRLTQMLRTALRIRTIGSIDISRQRRTSRRKEAGRARDRARRKKEGAKTRIEYLSAHSLSRQKPWQAEGMSRRTWYRRRGAQTHGTSVAQVRAQSPLTPTWHRSARNHLSLEGARTCATGTVEKRLSKDSTLKTGAKQQRTGARHEPFCASADTERCVRVDLCHE